jgi:hypothetical protein
MSTPWTRAPHPNPTVDSLRPTSGLPLPGRAPRLDCLPRRAVAQLVPEPTIPRGAARVVGQRICGTAPR